MPIKYCLPLFTACQVLLIKLKSIYVTGNLHNMFIMFMCVGVCVWMCSGFYPRWLVMIGCNQYLVLTNHNSNLHDHYYVLMHCLEYLARIPTSFPIHTLALILWQPCSKIVATSCFSISGYHMLLCKELRTGREEQFSLTVNHWRFTDSGWSTTMSKSEWNATDDGQTDLACLKYPPRFCMISQFFLPPLEIFWAEPCVCGCVGVFVVGRGRVEHVYMACEMCVLCAYICPYHSR